jgi:hypothetical protein
MKRSIVAAGKHFHAAISKVLGIAAQAQAQGHVARRRAKANALDPAANRELGAGHARLLNRP